MKNLYFKKQHHWTFSLKMRTQNKKSYKRKDIVLTKTRGEASYVALSFAGNLSLIDLFFSAPWKEITFDEKTHRFILEMDKARLRKIHHADKDNSAIQEKFVWPDSTVNIYEDCLKHT